MCKIWIFGGTTEGRLLAEYCSREKIEAWVSVASEYGEELLQEELMESGNAGNPDLNHNTKESGQCADKEICFAKKSLKTVQASSVIKVLRGRMDRYQMEEFIRNQGIHLVIDATHPHARLVSEEIQKRADGPVSAWNGACAQRANKTKHEIGSRLIPFRRQCHFFLLFPA